MLYRFCLLSSLKTAIPPKEGSVIDQLGMDGT